MKQRIAGPRGTVDLAGADAAQLRDVMGVCEDVAIRFGYQPIELPAYEETALFERSVGGATDIIEKELFRLVERSRHSYSLRPEGTASCVRAAIQRGLPRAGLRKLYYIGPMWRYERPQKGRYRQFTQFGAEALDITGDAVGVDQMLMAARMYRELGVMDRMELRLNHLGSEETIARYAAALKAHVQPRISELDEGDQSRVTTNPLRLLDSKSPQTQEVMKDAPLLESVTSADDQASLAAVVNALTEAGVRATVSSSLVRGLDYYTGLVHEWVVADADFAQSSVAGGGRYDTLSEKLGGAAMPACGFALGMERLAGLLPEPAPVTVDGLVGSSMDDRLMAAGVADSLRLALPNQRIELYVGGASPKNQRNVAMKAHARWFAEVVESDGTMKLAVERLSAGGSSKEAKIMLLNVAQSVAENKELFA